MSHARPIVLRRPVGLLAASVLAVAGLTIVPTTGAGAAPSSTCPPSFPVSQLTGPTTPTADDGTAVTGKVTTLGSTPDDITGTYVGTIEDGIARGVDLLVFKLAGSRITDADGDVDAGIWAGMSGTPLYADSTDTGSDDELVGAVSYGFSVESSDYAGVTPAAALKAVDKTSAASAAARVTSAIGQAMRADGVSASAVQGGLRRLTIPRAVSAGAARSRLDGIARKTGFAGRLAKAAGGGRVSQEVVPLAPGSPVATSASHGAVGYTGVGTVTAVCGSKVFAFGHPDSLTGPSTLTMHGAKVVMIQRDNSFGSYVVANVAAPVGRITQDRTAGIMGVTGARLPYSAVRTSTTVGGAGTRQARSLVSVVDALPFVLDSQATGEVDGLYDGYQRGTADLSWRITGRRSNGAPFSFVRTNRVADRYDIASVVGSDVTSDVMAIADNEFEDVTITDVLLMNRVTPRYYAYRLALVQARQRGRWVAVTDGSRVQAKPGKRVRLRLTLLPQRGAVRGAKVLYVSTKVPKKLRGQRALLQVGGLADSYGGFDDEEFSEDGEFEASLGSSSEATSFAGVLAALRSQNRNDQIVTTLTSFGGGKDDEEEGESSTTLRRTVQRAPSVTTGSRTLVLKVAR